LALALPSLAAADESMHNKGIHVFSILYGKNRYLDYVTKDANLE
jgi:hypothetical protein